MRVSVIGAGITGLSIAFHLLERGLGEVTVVDRAGVGAGASGIQPGGVRRQWGTRAGCLVADDSYAFYRDLSSRLGFAVDARLDECGYLFVADETSTLERLRAGVALQNELGIPSRSVTPDEAAALVPGLALDGFVGAARCPTDGYFDRPQTVVEAFAQAVRSRGGRFVMDEVVALRADGSGWRLETRDGGGHGADHVVVAAGVDTPALLAPLGVVLPITPVRRHLFLGAPIQERLLEPLVVAVDRGVAAKQLADGRLLASDLDAAGDPATEQDRWRRRIREQLVSLLPRLEYAALPLVVDGLYDMTPDGQPIVDAVADGLWVAAGFSGHGFMIAPSVGRLVADLVAGDPMQPWRGAFHIDRFDGAAAGLETHLI
jgi:glycine/D-amino acid oxidase-like deaminating enzyme